ncbi:Tad domain-containing protein [Brevibacillus migulae]|uniref:Tad domain-containing protein n=1 Tax=Brevibacillus migulae TaxID=1644114 RepID=UPI001431DF7E|nr:Tad domain-containing protein [Brevibacillus migulae]
MTRFFRKVRANISQEAGNVSLIVAGGMVTFLMLAALVADVGYLFTRQQKLQNALDAGALGGIQHILLGEQAAKATASSYVSVNEGVVTQITADRSSLTLQITGEEKVPLWFARIMGINESTVQATAKAKAGTVTAMKGIVPIAVPDQTFWYGALYELTEEAGDGDKGNYGFLDFSGGGANKLADYIENGYNGQLRVGEEVDTLTGINHGPVERAIDSRLEQDDLIQSCQSYRTATRSCERVVFLPVIDTFEVEGKKPVTVVGFAAFYLVGTTRKGGHMILEGRFLQMMTPGEMGQGPNYGVYTSKLTQS